MVFTLKKPNTDQTIAFSPVFCMPGILGEYGDGYAWYSKVRLMGIGSDRVSFVSPSATTRPKPAENPREEMLGHHGNKAPESVSFPTSGHVLAPAKCHKYGIWEMFFQQRWQLLNDPFVISFDPEGETMEEAVRNGQTFVQDFLLQYFERPHGRFTTDFAVRIGLEGQKADESEWKYAKRTSKILEAFVPLRDAGIPVVAAFGGTVPSKSAAILDCLCDAVWLAEGIPWGTEGIDWKRFASEKDGNHLVSPIRSKGGQEDGALYGPDCFKLAVDAVDFAKEAGVTVPIIAGNGIRGPNDVDLLRFAGASAVAIGSDAFLRPLATKAVVKRARETFCHHPL